MRGTLSGRGVHLAESAPVRDVLAPVVVELIGFSPQLLVTVTRVVMRTEATRVTQRPWKRNLQIVSRWRRVLLA